MTAPIQSSREMMPMINPTASMPPRIRRMIWITLYEPNRIIDWAAWYLTSGSFLPTKSMMTPVTHQSR